MSKRGSRSAGGQPTKRQKSAQSTSLESFDLRKGEVARIGDAYWVPFADLNDVVPGRIINITKCVGLIEVELQWFDKRTLSTSKLGRWEWVLTNETTTLSSRTLANRVKILRWPDFNRLERSERDKSLYYRLIHDTTSEGENAYRLSTHDKYEEANPNCNDWILCACGCNESLDPDDGYTYCTKCLKSTRDDHITKDSQRATSALRERQGSVYVMDLKSGTEEKAICACGSPFTSSTTGHESSSNKDLATPLSTLQIVIDVGTTYIRITMRREGKEFEFHETYESALMFREGETVPLQGLTAGVYGNLICPLKALIKPDPRTLETLRAVFPSCTEDQLLYEGLRLFGDSVSKTFKTYIEGVLTHLDCPSLTDLYKHSIVIIGLAHPSSFRPRERGTYLTGIYSAACQVNINNRLRMVALPEPVASFYAIKGLEDGRYLVLDVGGSTTDASIVEKRSPETIKVIHESGINLGLDTPDRLTADWLAKKTNSPPCDTLRAVRGWSSKLREDENNKNNENYELFGIDIQKEYEKHCEGFWGEVKAHFEDLAKLPGVAEIKYIVLCGGGAGSEKCQQLLQEQFPDKVIERYAKNPRYSHVLTGMEQRLKLSEPALYSPITLCVKHDEPDGEAEELLVITHRHQALQHAKLPSSQLGEKLVVFDVSFGDEDACLELRGTFQEVPFQTNKSGFRIVKHGASLDTFYQVGELRVSSQRWLGKKLKKKSKGLNVVQFSPCIGDGVLLCKGLLISAPARETHFENIQTMQLDQVKEMAEKEKDWTVFDEYTLVTTLNLNESYRKTDTVTV